MALTNLFEMQFGLPLLATRSPSLESAPKSYGARFQIQLDADKGKTASSMPGDDLGSAEELIKHWKTFQHRHHNMVQYRTVAFSTHDGWIGLGPDRMRSRDIHIR